MHLYYIQPKILYGESRLENEFFFWLIMQIKIMLFDAINVQFTIIEITCTHVSLERRMCKDS